jgi:acetyl-CoA synthetase
LSAIGCGGAVVYASGFGEAGEVELDSALVAASGEMPLLGPNTYGYVNALDGTAIWPDLHGLQRVDRGVAIVTQSGNIGINVTLAKRSLDIAMVVTAGNQLDIDIASLMESILDDPRVTAIGLQLESIEDVVAFGEASLRAANQGVPIVALKVGSSHQGSLVTASHTGALAGNDDVYGALFDFYGIARARSIPAFLETLKLAGLVGMDPKVLSLSASGGEAAHVADLASIHGVDLPQLTPTHIETVRQTAHTLVTVSNPMDYHTISWGDGAALSATFRALTSGPFDLAVLVLDFPQEPVPEDWWTTAEAFAEATNQIPGLVVSSLPENSSPETQKRIRGLGLIPMLGLVETVEAIGVLGRRRVPVAKHHPPRASGRTKTLDEASSKELLSESGLEVPNGLITSDPESSHIPYPMTVKVAGLDHKNRAGGVAVGVSDARSLNRSISLMPDSASYLVEETVTGVLAELLVNLRTTDLGWMITIGNGGSHVEEFDDRFHVLMPATRSDLEKGIDSLRIGSALRGSSADIASFHDVVDVLWEMVVQNKTVVEIEINPLALRSDSAVALDAMLTLTTESVR